MESKVQNPGLMDNKREHQNASGMRRHSLNPSRNVNGVTTFTTKKMSAEVTVGEHTLMGQKKHAQTIAHVDELDTDGE
jgi:hypothetical protein